MNPRLIGGEMTVWSDLDGRHGAGPVSAPALRPFLAAASGRTLVAGPHHPDLLASVPSSPLTLLARGLADANDLAARLAGRPGVTVLCGSLDKLAAAPAYDTVIALDGLGRLRSAEDDAAGVSWADDLARLVSVLRPGGRLVLAVENLFGLHRLLALPPAPTDADWGDSADEYDPTRPASPAALRSALAALGLEARAEYAAFPEPGNPSVLLSTAVLGDRTLRGWSTAAIRGAFDAPAGESLADPGRIAAGALRAGIGAELACGWVVVAQGAAGEPLPALPVAVVGTAEISAGTDLPAGPTLDELVLAASLRRDLPALRELLTAWQHGPAAGVPADRVVAGAGGTHTPLVPAGPPGTALARLAGTMIREGHAYLWPAPADQAELTALLAAMAGREAPEAPAEPPAAPPALRELLMERDRLTRELADARAKHRWYETMLLGREAELKRVRRVNAMLMATLPGKAAKASYGGLRAAKRALRKLKG